MAHAKKGRKGNGGAKDVCQCRPATELDYTGGAARKSSAQGREGDPSTQQILGSDDQGSIAAIHQSHSTPRHDIPVPGRSNSRLAAANGRGVLCTLERPGEWRGRFPSRWTTSIDWSKPEGTQPPRGFGNDEASCRQRLFDPFFSKGTDEGVKKKLGANLAPISRTTHNHLASPEESTDERTDLRLRQPTEMGTDGPFSLALLHAGVLVPPELGRDEMLCCRSLLHGNSGPSKKA
ncbi:hypothetical protein CSOJ01_11473 [Colletotrichum sojae]|uniref:Uncharacterized protein n=1 Tax=Colletotrichum sojae TaxID=2175907 RepID=A0A8H6MN19_9PEZI|nr:hypothetical protein CSOJ01_11473 [Colletotrichum sojae]